MQLYFHKVADDRTTSTVEKLSILDLKKRYLALFKRLKAVNEALFLINQ
jgi:hypothetical protein